MHNQRVFSGMGPTGRLHIGHYHGVIKNWCDLQNSHECYFMVADLAALTTLYDSVDVIKNNIWDMLIDWIAAGVDAEKATIFIQSRVPEHVELAWLIGMSTPLSWLENLPAYQEKMAKLKGKNLSTLGFLADPVMQTADILAYKASLIPVGADQVGHLDVAKEITRRFNGLYRGHPQSASNTGFFAEPQPLLTKDAQLPGLDGEKMSKSYGNAIFLRSSPGVIQEKINGMSVSRPDPQGPGEPGSCPVFMYHRIYSSVAQCTELDNSCRAGRMSCHDCKQPLARAMSEEQACMIERAEPYLARPAYLMDIVEHGIAKARKVAQHTMEEVRDAMGFRYHLPTPQSSIRPEMVENE